MAEYNVPNGETSNGLTLNDKDTMRALCDMGVDYILSDYPEYCVQARGHK